jgi:two-component system, LuxR family, sensor histidine kinase TtrS
MRPQDRGVQIDMSPPEEQTMKRLATMIILLLFATGNLWAADYSIGVLAKRGKGGSFHETWLLHGGYLREKTGHNWKISPLAFEEVEPALKAGSVDFILVNSAMYVELGEKFQLEPVASIINVDPMGNRTNQFGGVIFTSAKSKDIETPADAKGRVFIAVDGSSFGGYYMAVREMLDQGFDIRTEASEVRFAGTHDEVVKQVAANPNTVGTVRTDTLERMVFEGKARLADFKILGARKYADFPFVVSTALYPEWALLRAPQTSKELATQVQEALIQLPADSTAARLAKIAGWSKPMSYQGVKAVMDSMR